MSLTERKAAEIERKLASLDQEFARWEAAAKGADFERHDSQIRGVLGPLRILRQRVEAGLGDKTGDAYLSEARKTTRIILGIFRIWNFSGRS